MELPENVQDIIDEVNMKREEIRALEDEIGALLRSDGDYALYLDAHDMVDTVAEPMSISRFYQLKSEYEAINQMFKECAEQTDIENAWLHYGPRLGQLERELLY